MLLSSLRLSQRAFIFVIDPARASASLQQQGGNETAAVFECFKSARAKQDAGDWVGAASSLAISLGECLSTQKVSIPPELRETLLHIADKCYAIDRPTAALLYRQAVIAGAATQFAELRLIEVMLDSGDVVQAAEALRLLRDRAPLTPTGWFIQARLCHILGDAAGVRAALLHVTEANPHDARLHILCCNHFLSYRQPHAAREIRDLIPKIAHPGEQDALEELDARLEALLCTPELLLQKLRAANRPDFRETALLDIIGRFPDPDASGPAALALVVESLRALTLIRPITSAAAHGVLDACLRLRDWDTATRFLEQLAAENPAVFDQSTLVMRRFHIACLSMNYEQAAQLYDEHYRCKPIDIASGRLMLGFLENTGRCDEAAERLLELARVGWSDPAAHHMALLICKHTSLHARLIEALTTPDGQYIHPGAAELRQLAVDDLCIKTGGRVRGTDVALQPSARNSKLFKPALRLSPSPDQIGYLCVDQTYMLGAMTFLASYAEHNPVEDTCPDWTIFLDRRVDKAAAQALAELARKLALPLTLIGDETLRMPMAGFREEFAFFGRVHPLSRAAYMRLYAARHLLRSGNMGRIFYLDSDILCTGKIDHFLQLDFAGAPLLARLDTPSPPVRAAEKAHGLSSGTYFNSGVLVFDRTHSDTACKLDHAIQVSETEPDRLFYVDQCALNIAFAGCAAPLHHQFNHFVSPRLPASDPFLDATFIHYVDQPKPWEVSYWRSDLREPWLRQLALIRSLVPAETFRLVVAAANHWPQDVAMPEMADNEFSSSDDRAVSKFGFGGLSSSMSVCNPHRGQGFFKSLEENRNHLMVESTDAIESQVNTDRSFKCAGVGEMTIPNTTLESQIGAPGASFSQTPEHVSTSELSEQLIKLAAAASNPLSEFEALVEEATKSQPATSLAAGSAPMQPGVTSRNAQLPDTASLATPLFIVGSPRSGTSILTSALLAGGYHGFREGNFLPLLYLVAAAMEKYRHVFANGSDKVLASCVDWDELRTDVQAAFKKQVDALNAVAPWMDKSGNPEMIELIPRILELWPTGVVIFAKRRAIENVVSRLQKFPEHTFEYHCRDWAKNMTAWRGMRKLPGLRAIEIDQQEIIRNPKGVAETLAGFLGGSGDTCSRLEAVFRGDRPQQTEAGSAARVLDLETVAWSSTQLETFLRICWPEMQEYGYSLDKGYWDGGQ